MKRIVFIIFCSISIFISSVSIPVYADYESNYGNVPNSSYNSDYENSNNVNTPNNYSRSDFIYIFLMFYLLISLIYSITLKDKVEKAKKERIIREKEKKYIKNKVSLDDQYANLDSVKTPEIYDMDSEIKKYFPKLNEKKLIEKLYNIFIEIQEAIMNYDYDSLKRLCTDELYNSYKSDSEILKLRNKRHVMNKFSLISANIKSIKEENDFIIVSMYQHIKYINCFIDRDTGHTIDGNIEKYIHEQYTLEFIINKKNTDYIICPSCGAKVKSDITECTYCKSIVEKKYIDFVLSSKKKT